MGRLSALKPQLARLAPQIARVTDDHGHSRALEPWRKWYSTAEWERLRRETFRRDRYVCQNPDCKALTPRPVCDHIRRHGGDRTLFFDPSNLQTLCKPCHDRVKQAQERRLPPGG